MSDGVGGCVNVRFVDGLIDRVRVRISGGGVHAVVVHVRVDIRVRNRVRVRVRVGVGVLVNFVARFWMRNGVWICVRVRVQVNFFFF